MEMHQPSKLKNIGSNPIGVTKYDGTSLYLLNVGSNILYIIKKIKIMCKICNIQLKNKNSLAKHLIIHKLTLVEYYVKYEDFTIPKCECGYNCKLRKGLVFAKTCGSSKCVSDAHRRKHSDDSKLLISKKRKEWLKNNIDKHPWKRNNKFKSVPCEKLKSIFIENGILFEEELQPLNDRYFSIDIALIDKGIGIEINGNQHYNDDGKLKKYYKERKELIEEKGWKLYDIHYSKVYDDKFVSDLILMISGIDINIDLEYTKKVKTKNQCECGVEIRRESNMCNKCHTKSLRKVERPSIEQLKIDIKELGYAGTGRKYGVSDNAIRKWIK